MIGATMMVNCSSSGTAPIPEGWTSGGCNEADLSNDPNNCGSCGHVCPTGDVCQQGCCVSSCQGVDTTIDVNNCGSCGHQCGYGETCQDGQCITCDGEECPPPPPPPCDGGEDGGDGGQCAPGLTLVKTADPTTAPAGQPITYSYVVTNTGSITLTNIVVTDDAGTPTIPGDDHVFPTIASLAPGQSTTLTWTTIPPSAAIGGGGGGGGGAPGLYGFAVLSLGGDASHPNAGIDCSLATVTGNVGIPSYGKFTNAAPCVENGDFYRGTNVSYSGPGQLNGSTIVDESLMNSLRTQAFALATSYENLPATPSVQSQFPANGQISGNVTINGTSGVNVVKLSGLLLTGNLNLNAPAGAKFVLDIAGDYNLHSGNITVSGGMNPFDVVYNITDPSAKVQTMVPTTAVGVLLAPYNAVNVMDSSHFAGEIIGGYNQTIVLMSGTRITSPPTPPSQVVNVATATASANGMTVTASDSATVTIE